MMAYLSYMAERLVEIHRLLKPTGSLYLHCDNTAGPASQDTARRHLRAQAVSQCDSVVLF